MAEEMNREERATAAPEGIVSIRNEANTITDKPQRSELESARGIPSLDGLRALSILLVILAHSGWYLPENIQHNLVFQLIIGNGFHGVAIFFVISGYLITSLLFREADKSGTISLKHFYFRRTLRIFPPFYAFLAIMGILWSMRIIPEHLPSFMAAATYTWALNPKAQGYFIAHSWSLSIEELFYLGWPLAFLILHRRKRIIELSLLIIVIMPFLRVALYFVAPSLRGHEDYMIQGNIDTLMVGCLLALSKGREEWVEWQHRYLNAWTASAMAIVGLLVVPFVSLTLPKRLAGLYGLAAKPTLTAFCIGGFVVYLVGNPKSMGGRFLNLKAIRHIGVLSYSLYLWQQIFTSPHIPLLPYGFFYAFAAAELSYWLVEKPSLKLRACLESRK